MNKQTTPPLLFTLSTLLLLAAFAPRAEAVSQQMQITFGEYNGAKPTLTNFPVLVVLSNNVGGSGFNYDDFISSSGYDLRFVTNLEDTASLNYEIESWTDAGTSYVWVQVPEIPGDGSGTIYAKWGDSGDSSQLACTTNGYTWTNGYQAVWHMQAVNATDSTANGNNATPSASGVTLGSGKVGSAVALNGTSGYLEVAATDLFKGSDDVTIEFWVNPAASQVQYAEIMDYNHDSDPYKNWVVQLYSASLNWSWAVNNAADDSWGPWNASRTFTPTASVWTHVTLVKSGLTFIYYTNGGQLSSATHFATIDKATRILRIGAHASALDRFLNGSLDEIRIANAAKSADWVWACYQNQASPTTFNSYGTMTASGTPGAPAVANAAVTYVTTTSATFNGYLSSTGSSATAVCVLWGESSDTWANTNWFAGTAWTNNSSFSTNITTGIAANKTYYYTYCASNATTNVVASSPKSFITGEVTVEATDSSAQYPGDTGAFTIYRPAPATNELLTVYYTLTGTATNGVHYDTLPLSATISAGATSTVFTLTPKLVGVGDAILTLAGGYAYPVGTPGNDTVTIAASVIPSEIFVATNSASPAEPYGTWETAAHDIQTAVTYAESLYPAINTVTVSNGTYNITAEIAITAAITVRSFGNGVTGGVANASATIVKVSGGSGNRRIFVVTADATLDGFTMRDCVRSSGTMLGGGVYVNASGAVVQNCIMVNNNGDTLYGGGAYVVAGLVRNCTMQGNGNSDRAWGGGVYMTGGTVSNCVITGNTAGYGGGSAGGAYMTGGLLVSCRIYGNYDYGDGQGGGGVFINGASAVVRNCLIFQNNSDPVGGGVRINSGTIESSTIVGNNTGNASGGGGIYRNSGNAGTIRNCIVYNNTSGSATYKNFYSTSTANVTYTCTTNPVVAGTGCISGDPLFRDSAEGNYQLSTGSPCIDTGDDATVTWGTDLAGKTRKQDMPGGTALVDMGAYEYDAALTCDFLASPRTLIAGSTTYQSFGPAPLTVQFTGWADGTNLTGLVYRWDFDNNGSYEQEGLDLTNVSYIYTIAGVYNPRLQVTNSAAEVAEKIKSAYVSAGATHYVVTNNPSAAAPYTNWATAASGSIQAAIDEVTLHGSLVVVSNGTYGISSQITVAPSRIAIRSYGGGVYGGLANASNTVVAQTAAGGRRRVVQISGTDCELQGFTLTGGGGNLLDPGGNYGSGLHMYSGSGLVRDCIIRNNAGDNLTGCGVWMNGGTISNCIIRSNSCGQNNQGGGVYATAGQILHSQIYGNSLAYGGGVSVQGAVLIRNCLIRNNYAGQQGGGVYVNNSGALIESCTIVTNTANAGSNAGGGVYRGNGTVRNSIVYQNQAPNNAANANYYAGGGFEYSASDPLPPPTTGAGNILAGVVFQDPAASDYRLKTCAAVDAGSYQGWMDGALDLAGTNRIVNSVVDMGAYEFVPGALECGLGADVTTVLAPSNVVFTATVSGGNLDSLYYWWDFGDGNTAEGSTLSVVTNLYATPGVYTVDLMVTNAISEVAMATNTDYIAVWAANAYVATNSPSPQVPYTNWATAAHLIRTAADAAPAGVTIWATNGTYNETATIVLNKGVTVRSVEGGLSGASNTIVRATTTGFGGFRVFTVSHANAVVRGITIRDASVPNQTHGNGVNMSAGLVRDCIIRNNGFCDNQNGSGVYMTGGTVENCVIRDNQSNNYWGGGVYATAGVIRNCLIAANYAGSTGGGVYLAGGSIESCTIVANSANGAGGGGGIYRNGGTAGTVSNSIVYFNTAPASTYSNFYTTVTTGIGYTCTTNPVVAGTGCISDDPLFVDLAGGDYSLQQNPIKSPCINAGLNDNSWMLGATDLAGNGRILEGIVEIGAYESPPPPGTLFLLR